MKLPTRFVTIEFLLENLSLGRKPLSTFAAFQMPIAKNIQYPRVAYSGVACPKSYSHNLTGNILLLFNENYMHFEWGGGYMAYIFVKIYQNVHLKFLYFVKLHT